MVKVVCFLFTLILILAECTRSISRHNGNLKMKRESSKIAKNHRRSGEVFENLFNLYDPTFLSLVWPRIKNGVHLFVGPSCWEDVSVFFKDLTEGHAWAYKAVDASGRYQPGVFSGNRFWLGSKQQCLHLDEIFVAREHNGSVDEFHNNEYLNAVLRREKYFDDGHDWHALVDRDEVLQRLIAADGTPPHRLAYTAVHALLNITKLTLIKTHDITLGICLPRSCRPDDVVSIINFSIMINDNLKSNKTIPRAVKITSSRQIEDYYDIKTDLGAIVLICVTLFLVIIALLATIVELNIVKCKQRTRTMSFDLQKYNNTEIPTDIDDKHTCGLEIKETNIKDSPLTVHNVNANIKNDVAKKSNVMPPTVTLDVMTMERSKGCRRCGKYRKQCNTARQLDNLTTLPRNKYNSFTSLSTEYKNRFFRKLLLCFSLRYSWRRIFNTNMANKDLAVIHALRIFSTLWIIFVHVAMIVDYIANSSGDTKEYNSGYYMLATGTLGFDTLFFVSGLFSSHHFFYLKSQYTLKELVSFGGACGQVMQFVCFVTNRAIRLLPSYGYVIFLTGVLSRVIRDTSPVELPEKDYHNCDEHWWRNVLYISTVYPNDERCMQVSWYLSTETQLHVGGALLCAVVAGTRGRAVIVLAFAALLAATAADVSAAYTETAVRLSGVYAVYSSIIERPWARVAPYFIGVFTGWLVHRVDGRWHVPKIAASCLWLGSLCVVATSPLVPMVARPWVAAWLHLAWPLALMWPALVCATRYAMTTRQLLDSRLWAASSRLSYGMLLLHGIVARALLLSNTALCTSTLCLWTYFISTTLLSLIAALLLSLLVELPCCSILRRLSDCANT